MTVKNYWELPTPRVLIIKYSYYAFFQNRNLEEDRIVVWWRWRESNPLHQIVYNYLILLDIIRLLK